MSQQEFLGCLRHLNDDMASQGMMTALEHYFMGSTPNHNLLRKPEDWNRPQGILNNGLTIEEAMRLRELFGYFVSSASLPGIHGQLVIKFEKINPQAGETEQDPTVLGEITQPNSSIYRVSTHPGRHLTAELLEKMLGLEYFQRAIEKRGLCLRQTLEQLKTKQPSSEAQQLRELIKGLYGNSARIYEIVEVKSDIEGMQSKSLEIEK